MKRPANYNTKQREAILNYIVSLKGAHVTAAQITKHFDTFDPENIAIGRTTVFRHLDNLTEEGKIRRFITDGISGACYQYADHGKAPLHLKCEVCKELRHMECGTFSEIQDHILKSHGFEVNTLKTVLYGRCENCLKER